MSKNNKNDDSNRSHVGSAVGRAVPHAHACVHTRAPRHPISQHALGEGQRVAGCLSLPGPARIMPLTFRLINPEPDASLCPCPPAGNTPLPPWSQRDQRTGGHAPSPKPAQITQTSQSSGPTPDLVTSSLHCKHIPVVPRERLCSHTCSHTPEGERRPQAIPGSGGHAWV